MNGAWGGINGDKAVRGPITKLLITALLPGDSARRRGEDREHTRALAESGAVLPPIVVHRPSMRVVDGMHRLRAALIRGEREIDVEFIDGTEADAFVVGVRANVAHGLPLTFVEREAAARKIIASHPHLSDRSVAEVTGLSPKTVAAIRGRAGTAGSSGSRRVGRDGKSRPVNSGQARLRAGELLTEHPTMSLREVARRTGLSPATVCDVRDRIGRGEDPVPSRLRNRSLSKPRSRYAAGGRDPATADRRRLAHSLRQDPSLRFSESGREVLRWLLVRTIGPDGWEAALKSMPPHCTYTVVALARSCARDWLTFADTLEQRLQRAM